MIEGAYRRSLNPIRDERGFLVEILRCDWENFKGFGQVYITTALPGIVKAWHYHKTQTDNFCVIKGKAKIALYDARTDSPTFREIEEFIVSGSDFTLITIPPLVYHGFKNIGEEEVYLLNIPNRLYNYEEPDEFRISADTTEIPYSWR